MICADYENTTGTGRVTGGLGYSCAEGKKSWHDFVCEREGTHVESKWKRMVSIEREEKAEREERERLSLLSLWICSILQLHFYPDTHKRKEGKNEARELPESSELSLEEGNE